MTVEPGSATPDVPTRHRHVFILIALWLLVTAYNLFKSYHIDDTAYLEIARWIVAHPLHPMSGQLNWSGIAEPIYKINQPALYPYLLAAWSALFGDSEPAMHVLQSLFALACVFLFYRLARACAAAHAVWATALFVLGPAFVVEQNLMTDVPLLAVWLAFFNLMICDATSRHQDRRYLLAALACAAAILIKYSSLTLVPILWLSLLFERRRSQAWTAVVPVAVIAAWSLFNVFDYGGVHIISRPTGDHSLQRWATAALAWVLALGALTPLGIVALAQRLRSSTAAVAVFILAGAGLVLLATAVAADTISDRLADQILWLSFLANGILVCLALLAAARHIDFGQILRFALKPGRTAGLYLMLWIVGASAFNVVFAPFIASRHLLLILPAVTLLLAGPCGIALTRSAQAFALGITVVVSAGLCLADWRFAGFYAAEAAQLARSLPPAGAKWVSGHWGWQWYATHNGFGEIDVAHSKLQLGDYLAVAQEVDHQALQRMPPLHILQTQTQKRPLLNLFCTGRSVRFYASNERTGPWSISRNCLNHITVFRVNGSPPM